MVKGVFLNNKKSKRRDRKKEAAKIEVKKKEESATRQRKKIFNTVNYFEPDDEAAIKKKYRKQKVDIKPIPFDINGNMVCHVEPGKEDRFVWREVEPFRATMQIIKRAIVKKSFRFILMDLHTRVEYTMSMSKFLEMVDYGTIIKGQVRGDFFGTKQAHGHTLVYLRDYTQWET